MENKHKAAIDVSVEPVSDVMFFLFQIGRMKSWNAVTIAVLALIFTVQQCECHGSVLSRLSITGGGGQEGKIGLPEKKGFERSPKCLDKMQNAFNL